MPRLEKARPRHAQWSTIDGMILVAATGIGMVGAKEVYGELDLRLGVTKTRFGASLAQVLMLAWAVGLLIIGRNRLGGPAWRLMRRPGLSACGFGLAAVVLVLFLGRLTEYVQGPRVPRPRVLYDISQSYATSGYFILIAWSTQLATGVWRPSPDWADRLGRVLGVAWIVIALLSVVVR